MGDGRTTLLGLTVTIGCGLTAVPFSWTCCCCYCEWI